MKLFKYSYSGSDSSFYCFFDPQNSTVEFWRPGMEVPKTPGIEVKAKYSSRSGRTGSGYISSTTVSISELGTHRSDTNWDGADWKPWPFSSEWEASAQIKNGGVGRWIILRNREGNFTVVQTVSFYPGLVSLSNLRFETVDKVRESGNSFSIHCVFSGDHAVYFPKGTRGLDVERYVRAEFEPPFVGAEQREMVGSIPNELLFSLRHRAMGRYSQHGLRGKAGNWLWIGNLLDPQTDHPFLSFSVTGPTDREIHFWSTCGLTGKPQFWAMAPWLENFWVLVEGMQSYESLQTEAIEKIEAEAAKFETEKAKILAWLPNSRIFPLAIVGEDALNCDTFWGHLSRLVSDEWEKKMLLSCRGNFETCYWNVHRFSPAEEADFQEAKGMLESYRAKPLVECITETLYGSYPQMPLSYRKHLRTLFLDEATGT